METGRRGLLHLLGVDRWPITARWIATVLLAGVGTGAAWTSYLLEVAYRDRVARGESLSAWQNLFRLGAPWPPLVPVALAAVLLTVGWWHLRHAGPEPSHGLVPRPGREWTATELRRHLRRERGLVRVGFGLLSAIVALVVVRLAVYGALALGGRKVATDTVLGIAVEVVVCGAAWVSGGAWIAAYLERLAQWGVRDD